MIVLSCDARIHTSEEFDRGADIRHTPPKLRGGGGTSFCPVFEWVETNGVHPSAVIYFTDMLGEFPKVAPDYPVIWCATTDHTAPFGEIVRIHF